MTPEKIIIVGGVAGGASAAARARRLNEEAEIILLERGAHISFANCGLPYHIGGEIEDRDLLLVTTPEAMSRRFCIDVRTRNEAIAIDRAEKEVEIRDLESGRVYRESYDALILSPGAEPVRPPIPGIESSRVLSLRNMEDMDRIIGALNGRTHAAVVGGGYIGLEMAEALRGRGISTTLIELAPQVMGPADPEMAAALHHELVLHGVDLHLGVSVCAFEETADGVKLTLSSGEAIETGLAILAIGVKPESGLARSAGLEIGALGGIKVNDRMQTSDEAIYAVGDAVEVTNTALGQPGLIPLAGPANRQGRMAADNIFGRDSRYRGTLGTAICKVFNLAIGMTGLSEKAAVRAGMEYEKIYIHPASHASYYPGAAPLSLKLLFDPLTGRLLGAQAVGADGVDKRIDVLSTAIHAGMTVYDLEELELSYAPPFGSAKDPVNYAGFVAANVLRGDVRLCHAGDLQLPRSDQVIVDVGTPEEFALNTIPGAVNMPLDELRSRVGELAGDREYLVFCKVGQRGYLACRILEQNGLKCRNLSGGYTTWRLAAGAPPAEAPEPCDPASDPGDTCRPVPDAARTPKVVKTVNACGMQCPGPILQLKKAIDAVMEGEAVCITATDPGFASDAPAWCRSTGHEFMGLEPAEKGACRVTVVKRAPAGPCAPAGTSASNACGRSPVVDSRCAGSSASTPAAKAMTNVVFSGDFDKAMASFIIANGAAAAGYDVTLFFTFWGINILRRSGPVTVSKNPVERMFGFMMPRGADRLALSNMNMAGMGLAMIKGIMKKKNVMSLPELIDQARSNGVRMVVCSMSMDLMGIRREELIDGVEEGGVAMYVDQLGRSPANLFI